MDQLGSLTPVCLPLSPSTIAWKLIASIIVTLETKGFNPFKQSSKTFTAHPKVDAISGNLVGFGYEASGLATRDVCYFEIDPQGNVVVETYFQWPFVGFIHDCVLST